jgi:hypothetical protein
MLPLLDDRKWIWPARITGPGSRLPAGFPPLTSAALRAARETAPPSVFGRASLTFKARPSNSAPLSCFDCLIRLGGVAHFHKRKPMRASSVTIPDQVNPVHGAITFIGSYRMTREFPCLV